MKNIQHIDKETDSNTTYGGHIINEEIDPIIITLENGSSIKVIPSSRVKRSKVKYDI